MVEFSYSLYELSPKLASCFLWRDRARGIQFDDVVGVSGVRTRRRMVRESDGGEGVRRRWGKGGWDGFLSEGGLKEGGRRGEEEEDRRENHRRRRQKALETCSREEKKVKSRAERESEVRYEKRKEKELLWL